MATHAATRSSTLVRCGQAWAFRLKTALPFRCSTTRSRNVVVLLLAVLAMGLTVRGLRWLFGPTDFPMDQLLRPCGPHEQVRLNLTPFHVVPEWHCDELVFNAQDAGHMERSLQLSEHNTRYFANSHPTECYFNSEHSCRPLPVARPPAPWLRTTRNDLLYYQRHEGRYISGRGLIDMIREGQLYTKSGWFTYLDTDVIFANKTATFADLRHRVALALRQGQTVATRKFGGESFKVDPEDPLKSVALIVAWDSSCAGKWLINSGVQIMRVSRAIQFLHDGIMATFDHTTRQISSLVGMPISFSDQGRFEAMLHNAFELDLHKLRELCRHGDNPDMIEACTGTLPVMVGSLNIPRAMQIKEYRQAAIDNLQNFDPETEPHLAVLMCPRWMNASGCKSLSMPSENVQTYVANHIARCGDFLHHFNGCSKHEVNRTDYKQEISRCSEVWP